MLVSVTGTLSRELSAFLRSLLLDLTRRSATTGVPGKGGKGYNGGVWEWTSTVFDHYEGFVPSTLYPG